ncbi:hypothetical protein VI817_006631 [Penicillium citrinum]|nr:hypothetical protein VI817_006631 [Penicillium citrinum]
MFPFRENWKPCKSEMSKSAKGTSLPKTKRFGASIDEMQSRFLEDRTEERERVTSSDDVERRVVSQIFFGGKYNVCI